MNLQEIRQQVSGITQTQLAELMEVTQGAVSQLEGRQDALLSKLAEYVNALGGDLFPIRNLKDLGNDCPINSCRDDGIAAGDEFINVNVTPQGQASAVRLRRC